MIIGPISFSSKPTQSRWVTIYQKVQELYLPSFYIAVVNKIRGMMDQFHMHIQAIEAELISWNVPYLRKPILQRSEPPLVNKILS